MLDRKKARYLAGETIREIGILTLVFGPLDAYFAQEAPAMRTMTLGVVLASILVAGGIILESTG